MDRPGEKYSFNFLLLAHLIMLGQTIFVHYDKWQTIIRIILSNSELEALQIRYHYGWCIVLNRNGIRAKCTFSVFSKQGKKNHISHLRTIYGKCGFKTANTNTVFKVYELFFCRTCFTIFNWSYMISLVKTKRSESVKKRNFKYQLSARID